MSQQHRETWSNLDFYFSLLVSVIQHLTCKDVWFTVWREIWMLWVHYNHSSPLCSSLTADVWINHPYSLENGRKGLQIHSLMSSIWDKVEVHLQYKVGSWGHHQNGCVCHRQWRWSHREGPLCVASAICLYWESRHLSNIFCPVFKSLRNAPIS